MWGHACTEPSNNAPSQTGRGCRQVTPERRLCVESYTGMWFAFRRLYALPRAGRANSSPTLALLGSLALCASVGGHACMDVRPVVCPHIPIVCLSLPLPPYFPLPPDLVPSPVASPLPCRSLSDKPLLFTRRSVRLPISRVALTSDMPTRFTCTLRVNIRTYARHSNCPFILPPAPSPRPCPSRVPVAVLPRK